MLDFINPSHPSEFAVLRLVAEAQEGGGDVFDIGRLCKTLEPGDREGWEKGWLGLAEATEAKAKHELALGHKRTAMQFFFHANQYYRMSDVFLAGDELATQKGALSEMPGEFPGCGKTAFTENRNYQNSLRFGGIRRLPRPSGQSRSR